MLSYNDYLSLGSGFKIRKHRLPHQTLSFLSERELSISIGMVGMGKRWLVCFLSLDEKDDPQIVVFSNFITSVTKDVIKYLNETWFIAFID